MVTKKTYVYISSLCFHGNIAMVRGELFNSSLRKNCTMKHSLNEKKEERNGGLLGTEKWKETQIDRERG